MKLVKRAHQLQTIYYGHKKVIQAGIVSALLCITGFLAIAYTLPVQLNSLSTLYPKSRSLAAPVLPTQPSTVNYTVFQGQVLRNGQPITLKGVNWFGFETPDLAFHGLWARNYKEMITEMKGLGFNAIRIPFCPSTLKGQTPKTINYSQNQDLQGLNSLELLDVMMLEFNRQQIYILLDHHRPDCNAISQLWYINGYTETQWISDLKFVADRYKGLDYFMGVDLKNEPHGSATWGTGNINTDWNTAAEKAGAAVLATNRNVLIFVEGISDTNNCSSYIGHWWGGNLEPHKCAPISPAFIPGNKLVLSPHVYGPDVFSQSYFNTTDFPQNMSEVWNTHFGFLVDQGYSVIIGEWGGRYGNGGDPKDKTWQDTIANYFVQKKICHSFYWSWNPNSGDTGGILQDDWRTPWANKMEMLNNYFSRCQIGGPTNTPTPTSPPRTADINGDGRVNVFDLGILSAHYGVPINDGSTATAKASDINRDGQVNVFDLGLLIGQYERSQ